jgi:methionyl-tRNA formyltransferase
MGEHPVRVLDAVVERDIQVEIRQPGKVVFIGDGCPVVVCERGVLRITDMRDNSGERSLLPLKKLRTRFT